LGRGTAEAKRRGRGGNWTGRLERGPRRSPAAGQGTQQEPAPANEQDEHGDIRELDAIERAAEEHRTDQAAGE
jgi:hypothetical protein